MIDLHNLVEIHNNPETIRRHKRILEELFYLCINDSFESTIRDLRELLQERVLVRGTDLRFPSIRESVIEIRNEHFARNDEYRELLIRVSEKHRYFHPAFTRNYSFVVSDSTMRNQFNVLENIIFFNNPIPDSNPLEHFRNKSGYMEIAHDEIEGPYIRMHFDIGTSLREIKDIIDKQFPETSDLQHNDYAIPLKQYREGVNLQLEYEIHQQVLNEQDNIQIAVELERQGLYSEENTGDHVRMQRNRMEEKADRFTSVD